MASNKTFRLYLEKLGDTSVTDFVGRKGDLFIDPEEKKLRISDGITPGGTVLFSVN